jgi:CHAT domain-containing protein
MDRAAACGMAHDLPGCLNALNEALPALAPLPATWSAPQQAADQIQAARMAALAGDQALALRFACLLLNQVCGLPPADDVDQLQLANLYSAAFIPFVRSNGWLKARQFSGLGGFLQNVIQRIRPDLDELKWSEWAYPEELATRARDYAARAAVNLGRWLYEGPERESHRTDALILAQVGLDVLNRARAVRSSLLIASDAHCLIGRVLLSSASEGSDAEAALAAFEASLEIQTQIGSADNVATDQSNAAAVCIRIAEGYEAQARGERDRARRAAAERKPEIAAPATAAAERLAGRAREKWQRATELLDAAKPYVRQHPGSLAAAVLTNSAAARAQLGDLTAARTDLDDALMLGDAASKTTIHVQRGRLEMDAKDFVAAEGALAKALPGAQELVPAERVFLLGSYGNALRLLRRWNDALTYLDAAMDGVEAIGRGSLSARVGIALLKTHRWIPEALIACCAELDRPDLASRAFEVAERVRWRVFAFAIRYHTIVWSGPPHPLLAEEQTLLERIKTTDLGSPDVPADDGVAAAFGRLEEIWQELAGLDPIYVALRRREPVTAAEVAGFLDDEVTAFVVYYLGEEIADLALAWVFRRDQAQPRLIRLSCTAGAIAGDVDALRAADDSKPPEEFKAAGGRLHGALIAPVRPALPAAGGVCFVPFGPLHNVPFGALFDGQRFFVESRAAVVTPSLTALRWARRQNGRFDPQHSLIVAATGSAVINQQKAIDLSLFDELAQKILAPLLPGSLLVPQEQATKRFLLERLAEGAAGAPWDIVHIAGHGLFETLLPDGTLASEGLAARLVLTGPASVDRDWTALEIAVSVEPRGALVVLSACESGVSTAATNDELFGLAHAFVFAGSASILASMWYVVQQHGVELTRKFYSKLLDKKTAPSRVHALREAQLETMREMRLFGLVERPVHPYIWSAFQLMGDWRRHSAGSAIQ